MASFLFYLIIVLAVVGTGAVILAVRQTNRYFQAVTQAKCVSCGSVFGLATAKKARIEFEEAFNEVLEENPEWLVSSAREWPVVCPRCGMRQRYLLDEQKLLAEDVDVQGQ